MPAQLPDRRHSRPHGGPCTRYLTSRVRPHRQCRMRQWAHRIGQANAASARRCVLRQRRAPRHLDRAPPLVPPLR
eukprot:scaffold304561_cov31-Tisochrysis_lutea.AAC.2